MGKLEELLGEEQGTDGEYQNGEAGADGRAGGCAYTTNFSREDVIKNQDAIDKT